MKKTTKVRLYRWLQIILMIALSYWWPSVVQASPVITDEQVDAEVFADGTVKIDRYLTYQVDEMNGIYHQLDREGYEVLDYEVGLFDPETKERYSFAENYLAEPQTYQVTVSPQDYNFKLYYPAQDEELIFYLTYTLDGLVTNYADTAVFNYKLVGSPESKSNVWGQIVLPGIVNQSENLRAWGHGAPQGEVQLDTKDQRSVINYSVPNNPAGQFVEVHAIFPTSLTPHNKHLIDEPQKEQIIQQENDQVEQDRRDYERAQKERRLANYFFGLISVFGTLGAGFYYRRTKKRVNPHPVHIPEHVYELPAKLSPAVANVAFFESQPTSLDFSATLVDLARKKYLHLESVTTEQKRLLRRQQEVTMQMTVLEDHPPLEELSRHERAVFHYVTLIDSPVTLEELEKALKQSSRKQKKAASYWQSFINSVEIMSEQVVERATKENLQVTLMGFAPLAIVLMLALVLFIWRPHIVGWSFFAALFWTLLVGLMMAWWVARHPIETSQEQEQRQLWQGFKQMLTDIGQMDMREIASLTLWEEYLVYAVAFGLADRVIEAMNVQFSQTEIESLTMGPIYYRHPLLLSRQFPRAVSDNLTTAKPPVKYSSGSFSGSNTGGFGGGFSGGSSGGFGGGTSSGSF